MAPRNHIGCCGWSYLNVHDFDDVYTKPHKSKLQAYAELFSTVEINSTFYRLPRLSTAEKWRKEADAITPEFEFTVKAFQGITHRHRFHGQGPLDHFETLKEICSKLKAQIILFQSPASFTPTRVNIDAMQNFFGEVERDTLLCVWEPRGSWYDEPSLIAEVCAACNLIHCVDPFRNDQLVFGKIAYFRVHGFGKPSMYRYDFSGDELQRLLKIIQALPRSTRDVYVFFNNVECYRNGLQFIEMVRSSRQEAKAHR